MAMTKLRTWAVLSWSMVHITERNDKSLEVSPLISIRYLRQYNPVIHSIVVLKSEIIPSMTLERLGRTILTSWFLILV